MHARTPVTALALTAAAWVASAAPAWANAVDPELYPEAAEDYNRMMYTVFGTVFGCAALFVLALIAFAVLLVVWLLRRDKRKHAELLAAAPAPQAPPWPPVETPQAPDPS